MIFAQALQFTVFLNDDAILSIFSWSASFPKRKLPRKRTLHPTESPPSEMPSCSGGGDSALPDSSDTSKLHAHIAKL